MKINKSSFLLLSLFFVWYSCTENAMDDVNRNENDPQDVPARYLLTDAITSSAFRVTATDYAFYASVYIEHQVGIFNQMYNAEIRNYEPYSASTYNNAWMSTYANLLSLKLIREKCSEGGSEQGAWHLLGIAQILTAYNLGILTDLMGDIPWSEALQPGVVYQPKLDRQKDIYDDIFALLDEGIANLNKTDDPVLPPVGTQDLIYGDRDAATQAELWKQTAYGLKARYTMHLSFRNPDYEEVVRLATLSFKNAADQFQFTYDGSSAINPFYAFFQNRDYFGASESLNEKLTERQDPRQAIFFRKYPTAKELIFAPNGNPEQRQGYYGISGLLSPTRPTAMLSYHELLFLQAEAYARLSDLTAAENAFQNALKAAFVKVGLTENNAQEYYTGQIKKRFDTNPLSEIMIQKYLSFYEDEAIETYNDYRRWKAMGDQAIQLKNPNPFPLRFTYGSTDVVANRNVREAYGTGQYVLTENVWWAGGNR